MRILYVSPFPPARDGIGDYTEVVLRALRARGHDAKVIIPRSESVPSPDVLGTLTSRHTDLVALRDVVSAWKPDCIHLQFAIAAFGTRTPALLTWLSLMRSTGIPVVATMHEVTRDVALLRSAGRALYRALAERCDHVVVHTRGALSECAGAINVLPARLSLIPHPEPKPMPRIVTDAELRSRFRIGDSKLLLAFGFVHVDKGLSDLVRALLILRRSGTCSLEETRLVIAGTVRRRNGIFRLFELRDKFHLWHVLSIARRGGIDRNIVLTGYVPEEEVAGWFQSASAVVLPYRRTEQSGVAALASAFNVPILASTAGGLGELYAESRWAFPPRDPSKLAQVLREFFLQPNSEYTSIFNCSSASDLDSVITATINVYRSVALIDSAPRVDPKQYRDNFDRKPAVQSTGSGSGS